MILRLSHLLASTLLCAALYAGVARAQSPAQSAGGSGGGLDRLGPMVGGGKPSRNGAAAKPAPPPALPGAAVGQDRVTPSEKAAVDLSPNDSLFDAVNRGDIVSARDALNRGADPQARNVLGLTALDESIDLGRNDITFLLLSLRQANAEPPPVPAAKAPAKPAGAPPVAKPKPAPVAAAGAAPAVTTARQQAQAAKPVPSSGPSGTPNPQAGFLGFGG